MREVCDASHPPPRPLCLSREPLFAVSNIDRDRMSLLFSFVSFFINLDVPLPIRAIKYNYAEKWDNHENISSRPVCSRHNILVCDILNFYSAL